MFNPFLLPKKAKPPREARGERRDLLFGPKQGKALPIGTTEVIRLVLASHRKELIALVSPGKRILVLKMASESKTSAENSADRHLPIRMTSKVVRGFGRGSSDLGIPTANLSRDSSTYHGVSFDQLPCGIYWGFARVGEAGSDKGNGDTSRVFKSAISIGYNPTYGNEEKTVEPHLIASEEDTRRHASSCGETVLRDFYDEPIRLSVVGYLRPELPFEGLDKLIAAIKNDIVNADKLGDKDDSTTLQERAWVESNEEI